MTTITRSFFVMTRKSPPNHDSGGWTEHDTAQEAFALVERVGGNVLVKTCVDHGDEHWHCMRGETDLPSIDALVGPFSEASKALLANCLPYVDHYVDKYGTGGKAEQVAKAVTDVIGKDHKLIGSPL